MLRISRENRPIVEGESFWTSTGSRIGTGHRWIFGSMDPRGEGILDVRSSKEEERLHVFSAKTSRGRMSLERGLNGREGDTPRGATMGEKKKKERAGKARRDSRFGSSQAQKEEKRRNYRGENQCCEFGAKRSTERTRGRAN